jgi:regulatory protein
VGSRRGPPRAGPDRRLDAARARAVAFDLLSRKAWTRRELRERLCRRGAPAAVAEAVVADLEARGYVNDRAFAEAWAESRARGRGYGPRRLQAALTAKGVARPLVDEAVRQAFAETDEETRARAAAARRLRGVAGGGVEPAARRLSAYLLRRGFAGGIVRRVVRDMCAIEGSED